MSDVEKDYQFAIYINVKAKDTNCGIIADWIIDAIEKREGVGRINVVGGEVSVAEAKPTVFIPE